ncbi:putative phage abortive infection protein [Pasteurella bettyae]|uniref:putative phage abortive infection protein n=1 Tax=Pasteurella bettyae TaxID=752 RepID=UPI003D29219E
MIKEIINFVKSNKWYVLLVVLLLGLYFYQFHGSLSSKSEEWDHFGSYVGGIFSAVTLLSVLHGMQLERKRFNEQQAEFEEEKRQLEERRRKEDFERTFFMLLEQQNVKLNELLNKKIDGKSVVKVIYDRIMEYPRSAFRDSLRCEMEIGKLREYYTEINSYFLNLYRILKYIYENKDLNDDNKYSSLIRSYLPKNLLVILSYHLYKRDKSYDGYIHYINEFAFFEHLDLFVLECKYIYNVTKYDEKLIYELINLIRLEQYIEVDGILECSGFSMGQNKDKLQQIFDAKKSLNAIKGDFTSPYHESFYENVFFYTLCTFSEQAFRGNIDYENIKVVYAQFVSYIKSQNYNG